MNLDRKLATFAAALAASAFIATPAMATGGSGSAASGSSASSASDAGSASSPAAGSASATGSAGSPAAGAADASGAGGSPFPGTGAATTTPMPANSADARLRAECFDHATQAWRSTPECAAFASSGVTSASPGYSAEATARTDVPPATVPRAPESLDAPAGTGLPGVGEPREGTAGSAGAIGSPADPGPK